MNLSEKSCLVVGIGGVGIRKLQGLLDAGVQRVLVLDLACPPPEIAPLLALPNVTFEQRPFEKKDVKGQTLVIAATSNRDLNDRIASVCSDHGVLCNIVDQPDQGDFIVPASVRRGDLTFAISTGGSSPAMARRIRRELAETFGEEYAQALRIMGRIRPLLLELGLPTPDNTAVFRALTTSKLMECLANRDLEGVNNTLRDHLPPKLHRNISELLNGIL